jgi:uncharacterized protein (TIGR02117 family)
VNRLWHWLLLAAWTVFGSGCNSPVKGLFPPATGAPRKAIYLANHGWHTGLIVARKDIPTNAWPAARDFATFEYLEVGWGDDGFYRAEKITSGITLKALFWPTPSVLHVVGFNGAPVDYFSSSKVFRVELTPEGFERLCRFIDTAYARTSRGTTIPLGPGLYGTSEFYRADGSYYFPRSCNYWTASALRTAGCPVRPLCSVTAGCLMNGVRFFATELKPAPQARRTVP